MRVTKGKIDAALRSVSFKPTDPGPMRVILDVGDADYFMKRAEEFLISASNSPTKAQRKDRLEMALRLTALALVYDEGT